MQSADRPGDRIGLDLGTSALKGVRLRADGGLVATAERPAACQHPGEGRVEIDPETHWRNVAGLLRELAGASPAPVRALAISGASGNTLLADARGRPLRPILHWMDRRCEGRPPAALAGLTPAAVRRVTGWPCLDRFPLAHLGWLREHEPDTYRRAERVCMNTDWLLFRLTGEWVMDPSTATTFHLQDQVAGRWHRPFLERLGLAETQLSRLTDSGRPVGPLTPEAAAQTGLGRATQVVTGSFDHPSAARAVGVGAPGDLLLSCGTSWVGFLPWNDRQRLIEAELLCDPFLSRTGGPWGGMFSVPAIGPVIDAYVTRVIAPGEKHPLRVFDALAAQAPPGAGGLELDLSRPPRPEDGGKDRALVARAVMEGAARRLNDLLQGLVARGFRFKKSILVGGPGKSPVWPGILAETTGLDLTVGSAHSGATGAAILAGIGAGPVPPRPVANPAGNGTR